MVSCGWKYNEVYPIVVISHVTGTIRERVKGDKWPEGAESCQSTTDLIVSVIFCEV